VFVAPSPQGEQERCRRRYGADGVRDKLAAKAETFTNVQTI
jgi:hypothetical protein